MNAPESSTRSCIHCGRGIPQTKRSDAVYCSTKCHDRARDVRMRRAREADRKLRVCCCCGGDIGRGPQAVYCSNACALKYRRDLDRDEARKVDRDYKAKNRERVRELERSRYAADPERFRAKSRAANAQHPDRVRAATMKWRNANRDKVRAAARSWLRNHPEKNRIRATRRVHRVRAGGELPPNPVLDAVRSATGGRCAYCGSSGRPLTIDHIVPVSAGGLNEIGNLTFACKSCNSSKHDKPLMEWWESRGRTKAQAEGRRGGR